jgi:prevent-host-death family protein
MATIISQRELRNENADIVRRAEAGERFTVTRRGKPVASVVPLETSPEPPRLNLGEVQALWRGLPPVDTDGWWAEIVAQRRTYDEGVQGDVDEDAWARQARKNREREAREGAGE